jgi:hypothetical protein
VALKGKFEKNILILIEKIKDKMQNNFITAYKTRKIKKEINNYKP